jgi:hypothetical protein
VNDEHRTLNNEFRSFDAFQQLASL